MDAVVSLLLSVTERIAGQSSVNSLSFPCSSVLTPNATHDQDEAESLMLVWSAPPILDRPELTSGVSLGQGLAQPQSLGGGGWPCKASGRVMELRRQWGWGRTLCKWG